MASFESLSFPSVSAACQSFSSKPRFAPFELLLPANGFGQVRWEFYSARVLFS